MATSRTRGEPTLTPSGRRRTAVAAGAATSTAAGAAGTSEPKAISDEQLRAMVEGGAPQVVAGPTMLPPGTAGAEAAASAATGTWRSGMTVTAMWAINEPRNAWIYVTGLGWRRLYNGKDGAFMALVALAGQARQTGRQIAFREEADGMVYEIYLW